MADNKPSIEFHERGKRHKENVAKKLKDISKKSERDHRAQQKMDHDIRKMEQAAMNAYMMDVHAKADYSSQFVQLPKGWHPEGEKAPEETPTVPTLEDLRNQIKLQEAAAVATASTSSDEPKKLPAAVMAALPKAKTPTAVAIGEGGTVKHVKNYVHQKKLPKWYEAKTEDDKIYYWNIITQATSWEKPAGGFVSLKLQAKNAKEEEEKRKKQSEQWNIMRNPLKVPLPPSVKTDPYGKWKTVETESYEETDLQLPKVERVELQVPELTDDMPEIKFKEKKITSLSTPGSSSCEPPTFKKRKFGKINVRQRTEDDD